MKRYTIYLFSIIVLAMVSCADDDEVVDEVVEDASCSIFSADSAYFYVKTQVDMGPRVPSTAVQKSCASWLESMLTRFTDKVYIQRTNVTVGDKSLPCINLIGSINPDVENRILLLAHWDTRPWADKEDESLPMDGADDGASGVAVLLEIARQAQGKFKNIGVDILLVDVEDYGKTEIPDSYCKGSQYWAENPHVPNYTANFGILLDMVGGKGDVFYREGYSALHVRDVTNEVWNTATRLGYASIFPFTTGMAVTDDHVPVNEVLKIPTIDILGQSTTQDFPAHHHTTKDNMEIIDKNTLQAVGQTVLQVLCNENKKHAASAPQT